MVSACNDTPTSLASTAIFVFQTNLSTLKCGFIRNPCCVFKFVWDVLHLDCCFVIRSLTGGFVSDPRGFRVSQFVVSVESSFLTHH